MGSTMTTPGFSVLRWLRDVTAADDLSIATRLVATRLALYADGRTGAGAFPGNARLADDLGVSVRTVVRAMTDLHALGAVQRDSLGSTMGRRARASSWRLLPAPWAPLPADEVERETARRARSAPRRASDDTRAPEHVTSTTRTRDNDDRNTCTDVTPPVHGPAHGPAHGSDAGASASPGDADGPDTSWSSWARAHGLDPDTRDLDVVEEWIGDDLDLDAQHRNALDAMLARGAHPHAVRNSARTLTRGPAR